MTKEKLIDLTFDTYEFIILNGFSSDLSSLTNTLSVLSSEFKLTEFESVIYSLAYQSKLRRRLFDYGLLSKIFKNSPTKLKEAKDAVQSLVLKGLFVEVTDIENFKSRTNPKICPVDRLILNKNPKNDPYIVLKEIVQLSNPSIIYENYSDIEKKLKSIINSNRAVPLIKLLIIKKLTKIELFFIAHLIWSSLRLSNKLSLNFYTDELSIFPSVAEVNFIQSIVTGKSNLLSKKLITRAGGSIENDELSFDSGNKYFYSLSNEFISELKLLNMIVPASENTVSDDLPKYETFRIIEPETISTKELFYSKQELKTLHEITSLLLNRQKFNDVIQKLKANSMSTNLSVLLFGSPGTGKTEWVKQLSLKTKRRIMQVEISQVRSKWLGETEKIIKNIFKEYEKFKNRCKDTPILLLNEADAVISKRNSFTGFNRSKVENNIQNILLEEIENFDGILVATTNIVKNFDEAFDRRFLFKVELSHPDIQTREKIWKSKIPSLTEIECALLAQKFSLSGGQIENIRTKSFINYLTQNIDASFEAIAELCEKEKINQTVSRKRIGFKVD